MAEFRGEPVKLVKSKDAEAIYAAVRDLPIIDYHCHLSPREIYEDKQFGDICEMWLKADHYKWRLMRTFGVDERLITGDAPAEDKFRAFAKTVEFAIGNPIKDWAKSELRCFFGITDELNECNADAIRTKADAVIKSEHLSPRKLMAMSGVEYVATTDDPCDDLAWHEKIAADKSFDIKVAPSFRTDNLVSVDKDGYRAYLDRLSNAAGCDVDSWDGFKSAVAARLDFFKAHDCSFSDVGAQGFPSAIADDTSAARIYGDIYRGAKVSAEDADALKGAIFLFLAREYVKRGITMQLHIAVARNCNSAMFKLLGADAGFDCAADSIPSDRVARMLDAMNSDGALPRTIIYSLNPTAYYPLTTLAGAFKDVHIGVSWWFCDHERGMRDSFETIGELGHICSLVGMLTDSRSFLSYTRHDYYRQTLCNYLADHARGDLDAARAVAKRLCYDNAKAITEGK